MDASFVQALQAAKNPEDKAALIAEASLSMFSDETARVARQCVLFHWFDQSIVEALLQAVPPDTERVQDVYRQITSLPFVEQLSWGVAYQDLTRQGLLKHYAHTQPELLKSAAQIAVPLYRASTGNNRNAAEALFCSIISGDLASHLHLNMLLEQAMNQQDWQQMEGLFRLQEEAEQLPFVESLPRTEDYWMLRSIVDRVHDRLNAALTDYNRALAINPQNALAYINRSIVHRQQKHRRQALADYNEALRLDPALVQTYVVDNRLLSPQPNCERRKLVTVLVGGVVTLLVGAGAVVAFTKFSIGSGYKAAKESVLAVAGEELLKDSLEYVLKEPTQNTCPSDYPANCGDHCCASTYICCGGYCAPAGSICCNGFYCASETTCSGNGCCPSSYPVPCGSACCPSGYTCNGQYCCSPDYSVPCGSVCCPSDSVCCNGACGTPCGSGCCPPGHPVCRDGHCFAS